MFNKQELTTKDRTPSRDCSSRTGEGMLPQLVTIKTEPLDETEDYCPEQKMCSDVSPDDEGIPVHSTASSGFTRDEPPASFWLRSVMQGRDSIVGQLSGSSSGPTSDPGVVASHPGPYSGPSLLDLLERGKSTNSGSRGGIQPSPAESDLSGTDSRGATRLRRLLQGEDVTIPPLDVWKNRDLKRCEDLECARRALKYFLGRHRSSMPTSEDAGENAPVISELVLKCTFCDHTNSTEEDATFIQHMFSHSMQGDFDGFNSTCPKCSVTGLPNVEFVCHAFSHCICSVERFYCSLCNSVVAGRDKFREHLLSGHGLADVKSEKME